MCFACFLPNQHKVLIEKMHFLPFVFHQVVQEHYSKINQENKPENHIMLVQVTARNVGDPFLRHSVDKKLINEYRFCAHTVCGHQSSSLQLSTSRSIKK